MTKIVDMRLIVRALNKVESLQSHLLTMWSPTDMTPENVGRISADLLEIKLILNKFLKDYYGIR